MRQRIESRSVEESRLTEAAYVRYRREQEQLYRQSEERAQLLKEKAERQAEKAKRLAREAEEARRREKEALEQLTKAQQAREAQKKRKVEKKLQKETAREERERLEREEEERLNEAAQRRKREEKELRQQHEEAYFAEFRELMRPFKYIVENDKDGTKIRYDQVYTIQIQGPRRGGEQLGFIDNYPDRAWMVDAYMVRYIEEWLAEGPSGRSREDTWFMFVRASASVVVREVDDESGVVTEHERLPQQTSVLLRIGSNGEALVDMKTILNEINEQFKSGLIEIESDKYKDLEIKKFDRITSLSFVLNKDVNDIDLEKLKAFDASDPESRPELLRQLAIPGFQRNKNAHHLCIWEAYFLINIAPYVPGKNGKVLLENWHKRGANAKGSEQSGTFAYMKFFFDKLLPRHQKIIRSGNLLASLSILSKMSFECEVTDLPWWNEIRKKGMGEQVLAKFNPIRIEHCYIRVFFADDHKTNKLFIKSKKEKLVNPMEHFIDRVLTFNPKLFLHQHADGYFDNVKVSDKKRNEMFDKTEIDETDEHNMMSTSIEGLFGQIPSYYTVENGRKCGQLDLLLSIGAQHIVPFDYMPTNAKTVKVEREHNYELPRLEEVEIKGPDGTSVGYEEKIPSGYGKMSAYSEVMHVSWDIESGYTTKHVEREGRSGTVAQRYQHPNHATWIVDSGEQDELTTYYADGIEDEYDYTHNSRYAMTQFAWWIKCLIDMEVMSRDLQEVYSVTSEERDKKWKNKYNKVTKAFNEFITFWSGISYQCVKKLHIKERRPVMWLKNYLGESTFKQTYRVERDGFISLREDQKRHTRYHLFVAHNCRNYDSIFLHDIIANLFNKRASVVYGGNKIVGISEKGLFHFVDTNALKPSSLDGLAVAYGIDKELNLRKLTFPYLADTTEGRELNRITKRIPETKYWEGSDLDTFIKNNNLRVEGDRILNQDGTEYEYDMNAERRKYCYQDVLILVYVWRRMYKQLSGDIDGISYDCRHVITAASLAFGMFTQNNREEVIAPPLKVRRAAQSAYFGGYTCHHKEFVFSNTKFVIIGVDINSSYPASMLGLMPGNYKGTYREMIRGTVPNTYKFIPSNLYLVKIRYIKKEGYNYSVLLPCTLVRGEQTVYPLIDQNDEWRWHYGIELDLARRQGAEIYVEQCIEFEQIDLFSKFIYFKNASGVEKGLYPSRLRKKDQQCIAKGISGAKYEALMANFGERVEQVRKSGIRSPLLSKMEQVAAEMLRDERELTEQEAKEIIALAAKEDKNLEIDINYIKLIMNSCYGKFAQRPFGKTVIEHEQDTLKYLGDKYKDEDQYNVVWGPYGDWNNPHHEGKYLISYATRNDLEHSPGALVHIAGFITARSRVNLFQYMISVGIENVIYCDTDSVYYITERENVMFENYRYSLRDERPYFGDIIVDGQPIPNPKVKDAIDELRLGAFKVEKGNIEEMHACGSKLYEYFDAKSFHNCKIKGIRNKKKELTKANGQNMSLYGESIIESLFHGDTRTINMELWQRNLNGVFIEDGQRQVKRVANKTWWSDFIETPSECDLIEDKTLNRGERIRKLVIKLKDQGITDLGAYFGRQFMWHWNLQSANDREAPRTKALIKESMGRTRLRIHKHSPPKQE